MIGFASGDIPRLPLNLPLLMERKILGVFWGGWTSRNPEANRANILELAAWITSGRLKPYISATYPLERAAEALRDLMDRKVQGKAVIVTG